MDEIAPNDLCAGSGKPGDVTFAEPGDDWSVRCPECGMRWAGGSHVVEPHADARTR